MSEQSHYSKRSQALCVSSLVKNVQHSGMFVLIDSIHTTPAASLCCHHKIGSLSLGAVVLFAGHRHECGDDNL